MRGSHLHPWSRRASPIAAGPWCALRSSSRSQASEDRVTSQPGIGVDPATVVMPLHLRVVEAPAAGAHAAQVGRQHRRRIEVLLPGLVPAILGVDVQHIVTARFLEQVGETVDVGVCSSSRSNQQGCGQSDPLHNDFSMFDGHPSCPSVAFGGPRGSRALDYKSFRRGRTMSRNAGVAQRKSGALIRRRSVVRINPPAPASAPSGGSGSASQFAREGCRVVARRAKTGALDEFPAVVQLARTPECGSGGRRFESVPRDQSSRLWRFDWQASIRNHCSAATIF
jgi:hypothetical protein